MFSSSSVAVFEVCKAPLVYTSANTNHGQYGKNYHHPCTEQRWMFAFSDGQYDIISPEGGRLNYWRNALFVLRQHEYSRRTERILYLLLHLNESIQTIAPSIRANPSSVLSPITSPKLTHDYTINVVTATDKSAYRALATFPPTPSLSSPQRWRLALVLSLPDTHTRTHTQYGAAQPNVSYIPTNNRSGRRVKERPSQFHRLHLMGDERR